MKQPILQLAAISSLAFTLNSSAAVLHVDLNSTNATPPYTNWAMAATNIQDAIGAADPGDTILVTNGVYNIGSRLASDGTPNRVMVTNSVTLQSVNGPMMTLIDGGQMMRCVYLTDGAVLAGFTLTNGVAPENGGGVWCESVGAVVTNCVLVGNSASSRGGGASYGTLNNCTLTGNSTPGGGGGGAYSNTLNNCTLTRNSAGSGGGAYECVLNNCVVRSNTASFNGGGAYGGALSNCVLTGNSASNAGGGAFPTSIVSRK